jgi:hypothetical protein
MRLRECGYAVVDRRSLGTHEIALYSSEQIPKGGSDPACFYEVSLNLDGLDPTDPAQQHMKVGRQFSADTARQVAGVLREWVEQYGTILIGSFNPGKTTTYRAIMRRMLPDLRISPHPGFIGEDQATYFAISR